MSTQTNPTIAPIAHDGLIDLGSLPKRLTKFRLIGCCLMLRKLEGASWRADIQADNDRLAEVVGLLAERRLSLALAGRAPEDSLANYYQYSGSSEYFLGGVVAYSNESR